MAKAVIMLALIKEKLNDPKLMKDCVYFDEKNGLRAANRIKRRMRKVRDMSAAMYKDLIETQRNIKISHGRKVKPRMTKEEKRNVARNNLKKFQDSQK